MFWLANYLPLKPNKNSNGYLEFIYDFTNILTFFFGGGGG